MTVIDIPKEIKPFFAEIAERLWTGHASVMVGAGFSQNAINIGGSKSSLPNWNQLGDFFFEKVYGKKPCPKDKYLNPLKLADEVQAAYGRSVLDQLLKKHIKDKDFEPAEIHTKLLELPWADVFTTNYDTLLERSCDNVLSRRYDIVINQEDIVYSKRPRIVKLHGSFPSERPLIITEEDYRTYPKKFAPFVNTVQQSLLENTLCLIGFSGEDPNFLQWIGWINDNIGKDNSPKIYLIGVLNLTDAQKRLMSSKNIVPLDLSICDGVNGNQKNGLDLFLSYLSESKNKKSNLEWSLLSDLKTIHHRKEQSIESLIFKWKSVRLKYPNWIILPQEQRVLLWTYTSEFSSDESVFDYLSDFIDLDYIYELNWRMEKCLFPLWNNIVPHFQRIINRYNPFPSGIDDVKEINHNSFSTIIEIDWDDIQSKWITLSLSLLRFYREESFKSEWESMEKLLCGITSYFTPDQLAQFYYEKVLMSIFNLNNDDAKNILSQWPINISIPFWEAKRASLIAELGQIEDAERIAEESLVTIRKRLNLSPIEDDYNWVSQEAYVMFLLKFIKQNIQFSRRIYADHDSQNFNERWNNLLQYKCDPWGEKKYFDMMLQQKHIPPVSVKIKHEFEIGRTTRISQLGGSDGDSYITYTFLRYLEEIGIPISLPYSNIDTKTINGVLERLMLFSPNWGFAIMSRCRDYKTINYVLDREYLRKVDHTQIDKYIEYYLERFEQLFPLRSESLLATAFTDKVPAILSRLCVKCSELSKLKIFKFYQKISKLQVDLPDFDTLLKNLVDASNNELLDKVFPILLDTPVLNDEVANEFIEPFDRLQHVKIHNRIKIKKEILNDLFAKSKNSNGYRKRALKRLIFLYSNNLLNQQQEKKLFNIIWEERDHRDDFPKSTCYYNFAFIKWPQPDGINALKLYKEYIANNIFSIQSSQNDNKKGINISGGIDRYAGELWHGSFSNNNKIGIRWTEAELENILSKCEQWWNADKHFLIEKKYQSHHFGGSVAEEFQARFKNLTNIIARIFGCQQTTIKDSNTWSRIRNLIIDIENHNIPVLKGKGVFGPLVYNSSDEYLLEIRKALVSNKRSFVFDALESFILVVSNNPYHKEKGFIKLLINIITTPLNWRIERLMGNIFDSLTNLIENSKIELEQIEIEAIEALEYLSSERDRRENFDNEFLFLNQKAISFASCLHRKCIDRAIGIPKVLLKWKEISENPNEFGDIVNHWH